MTNVINHDFGFRNPNGYDADERFDLRQNALLMSVNWQVDVLREVAMDLFAREAEVDMHKAIPLFDIMQSIYRDITMPFTITSDLGLRRDRTPGKNFSATCFHFPMKVIHGINERVESGDFPVPSLQTEVTYCDYEEGYDESNMFHTLSTQTITPPEGNGINTKILTSIGENLNKFVEMNGGFSRVTTTDDEVSHPAMIGFIPYSEVQYVRISLVMSGSN